MSNSGVEASLLDRSTSADQGPACPQSPLVDGVPSKGRVLRELNTKWLVLCASGVVRGGNRSTNCEQVP